MEILLSNHQDLPVDGDGLRALAAVVLEKEDMPSSTEVGIMLVTDDDMAVHNQRFLGREGPTDVLALPLAPRGVGHQESAARSGAGVPYALGDVIIAPGYVEDQARRLGTAYEDEMALMVTHGLLHLIGYDHESDSEAEQMESRERHLLAAIGMERR
ncbi:MAG: rRNA maturation RNase YbeY [Acidimicrobiia bacterium]|nr:rRNA maturation RNase YbeY [Acidimicrobiia bacterium]